MTRRLLPLLLVAALIGACAPPPPVEVNPNAPGGFHIVKAGDTYDSVAAQHRVETPALLQLNKLTPEAPLRAGQALALPAPSLAAAPAAPASAPGAPVASATAATSPAAGSAATPAAPVATAQPATPVAPAASNPPNTAPGAVDPVAPVAPITEAVPPVGAPAPAPGDTVVEVRPAPPSPFSPAWFELQSTRLSSLADRAGSLYTETMDRPYGIVIVAVIGLVAGFIALQLLLWVGKSAVIASLPFARRLGAVGHELVLNVWYAAWWAGLAFYVPALKAWTFVQPWVEPRARALGRYALEHGTAWSRRAAAWLLATARQATITLRDEAIDALEELALKRPVLRGVADRMQSLAYQRETHALRSRIAGTPGLEVWPPAETSLLAAMESGAVAVRFAPAFDPAGESILALDTTLRWDRRDGVAIPDARLASAIERPGYTQAQRAALELLLREATQRLTTAIEEDSDADSPTVILHLGRAQFYDPTLCATLRRSLRDSNLPPAALEFTVDERAVLHDLRAAGEILTQMHEIGVRTNVREFGALTADQLEALAVSAVTIDFWNSKRDERVSRYVAESVRTAHQLQLPVTAARAEMPDEIEFARALGCERIASPHPQDTASPAPQPVAAATPTDDTSPLAAAV